MRRCHGGTEIFHVLSAELSPVNLSLEEVRECGLPAYFYDYGEALVYMNELLFEASDLESLAVQPEPLPQGVLESGVGIEYGWRHAHPCRCRLCAAVAGLGVDEAA
jgi:hypothetical protein